MSGSQALPELEFWFEFASTYSYLSASRIEAACQAAGVRIVWKPFLLGPIFKRQGWNDSPFNLYPVKGAYMWRDMERLADKYGLAFARPSVFPRNGLLAARVACSHSDAPWLPGFVRAVYAANFNHDRDISEPSVIAGILESLSQPGDQLVNAAGTDTAKAALRTQTEAAEAAGIFGAPSFVVGDELFWGNDRMGDAIAHALFSRL